MNVVQLPKKSANTMQESLKTTEKIYTLGISPEVYPMELNGIVTESMWQTFSPTQKVQMLKEAGLYSLLAEVDLDPQQELLQSAEGFQGEMFDPGNIAESVPTENMPYAQTRSEDSQGSNALPVSQLETLNAESPVEPQGSQIESYPATTEQSGGSLPAAAETSSIESNMSTQPQESAALDRNYEEFKKAANEIHEISKDDTQEQFGKDLENVEKKEEALEGLSLEEKERIDQESGAGLQPSTSLPPKFFGYSITNSVNNPNDPKATSNSGPVDDAKTWAYTLWQKVLDALAS